MTDRISLKRVAHHEAGHAVAAYVEGRRIRYVTVVPQPERNLLGLCALWRPPSSFRPDLDRDRKTRKRAEGMIFTWLAGHAADEMLTGRALTVIQAGSWVDWSKASDLVEHMTDHRREVDPCLGLLWVRTLKWVRLYWPAITALAKVLHGRRRPGGTGARDVIRAPMGGARTTGARRAEQLNLRLPG